MNYPEGLLNRLRPSWSLVTFFLDSPSARCQYPGGDTRTPLLCRFGVWSWSPLQKSVRCRLDGNNSHCVSSRAKSSLELLTQCNTVQARGPVAGVGQIKKMPDLEGSPRSPATQLYQVDVSAADRKTFITGGTNQSEKRYRQSTGQARTHRQVTPKIPAPCPWLNREIII